MLLVVGGDFRIMDDREMNFARARSRVGAVIFFWEYCQKESVFEYNEYFLGRERGVQFTQRRVT